MFGFVRRGRSVPEIPPPTPDAAAYLPAGGRAEDEAALDRRVVEIDRFAREHPDRWREILARWEAFRAESEGTGHEAYAVMAIASTREAWERAATAAHRETAIGAELAAEEWRWDEVDRRLASFPESLRGTSIDAERATLEARLGEERRRWQGRRVYAHADFRDAGGDFRASDGLRIEVQKVAHDTREGHAPHLTFLENYHSWARFRFPVDDRPRQSRLRLRHVVSLLDGDRLYAPITVALNGEILAGDWSPGNNSWVSGAIWDVSEVLREGTNELVIQLQDGFCQYWLEVVEVVGLP